MKGQPSFFEGRKHSEVSKAKNRLANLGKRRSPRTEFKAGQTSPRKGIKLPPEQVALMRETSKRLWLDPEFRAKQIAKRKGKPPLAERSDTRRGQG